ncbi:metallophosphoesterase family protein [Winogradskyella sp. MIT101101]|uniref:metallophosphoesterase family protein n=1 Tax=Winogradskyella sp. MIT101101 TaxID=3098297 RepID=UPI003999A848
MRTLAIGDIHGGLRGLTQLLERAKVNKDDKFIFLGDYVDGWSESAQVIQYLIELSEKNECVFIKGNHDIWCEKWLQHGTAPPVWLYHGGKGTIESYKDFSKEDKQKHLEFFQTMPMYYIDNQNRLYVHAGFTSMHGVKEEKFDQSFCTDRTLWEMVQTMDKRIKKDADNYPNRLKHYSEIYIGHTPTLRSHSYEPMNKANVWNVDTGAAFTGMLSAIDIDTKEIFQSDTLPKLYPDEDGRNG